VAILPLSVAEEPGHPVRLVRLDPEPSWAPSLAWSAKRRPSPALAALLNFVTEHPDLAAIGNNENILR